MRRRPEQPRPTFRIRQLEPPDIERSFERSLGVEHGVATDIHRSALRAGRQQSIFDSTVEVLQREIERPAVSSIAEKDVAVVGHPHRIRFTARIQCDLGFDAAGEIGGVHIPGAGACLGALKQRRAVVARQTDGQIVTGTGNGAEFVSLTIDPRQPGNIRE